MATDSQFEQLISMKFRILAADSDKTKYTADKFDAFEIK